MTFLTFSKVNPLLFNDSLLSLSIVLIYPNHIKNLKLYVPLYNFIYIASISPFFFSPLCPFSL